MTFDRSVLVVFSPWCHHAWQEALSGRQGCCGAQLEGTAHHDGGSLAAGVCSQVGTHRVCRQEAQPTCAFVYSPDPQPVGWWLPHSRRALLPQPIGETPSHRPCPEVRLLWDSGSCQVDVQHGPSILKKPGAWQCPAGVGCSGQLQQHPSLSQS